MPLPARMSLKSRVCCLPGRGSAECGPHVTRRAGLLCYLLWWALAKYTLETPTLSILARAFPAACPSLRGKYAYPAVTVLEENHQCSSPYLEEEPTNKCEGRGAALPSNVTPHVLRRRFFSVFPSHAGCGG